MKNRACGSAGFLSFLLRSPRRAERFLSPPCEGGGGGGGDASPGNRPPFFLRNKAVISRRFLAFSPIVLAPRRTRATWTRGPDCASPPPLAPPSQGGEIKTPRATKMRGWQRLLPPEKAAFSSAHPLPAAAGRGEFPGGASFLSGPILITAAAAATASRSSIAPASRHSSSPYRCPSSPPTRHKPRQSH